jgi:hypothetical protein
VYDLRGMQEGAFVSYSRKYHTNLPGDPEENNEES